MEIVLVRSKTGNTAVIRVVEEDLLFFIFTIYND